MIDPGELNALRVLSRQLGGQLRELRPIGGGFSGGSAWRIGLVDGREVFAKSASRKHARAWEGLAAEIRVSALLPRACGSAQVLATVCDAEWRVAGFEYLTGKAARSPWERDELELLVERLTDSRSALAAADELPMLDLPSVVAWQPAMDLWRSVGVAERAERAQAWRAHWDELGELESLWEKHAAGGSVVHLDPRPDNVLIETVGGARCARLLDWRWAARGASWLDLALVLVSAAGSGHDATALWRAHPVSAGVEDVALDSFLAALLGMWLEESSAPTGDRPEALRVEQARWCAWSGQWLSERRGWRE